MAGGAVEAVIRLISFWAQASLVATLARRFMPGNQDGQALIEYALIVTLVVVVVLIVVIMMGNQVHNAYCNVTGGFSS
jgi:Flp pilus assembly pilin Flp